jgi:DNA-binding transcriptional ArsR family regulator
MLDHRASLDRVFQALADPTRRAIVERLSRGNASVSQIAEPFAMSLAAVVQHVQVLEECGLVHTRKVGRVRNCRVDLEALRKAERWIAQRRSVWERRLDRLGTVLAELEEPSVERKKR